MINETTIFSDISLPLMQGQEGMCSSVVEQKY